MLVPVIVSKVAATIGISANLLFSVCFVETGFTTKNNFVDGHQGSFGLCELNLNTARSFVPWVDRLALQQDELNLTIAAMYLKKLQDKYHNDKHVASAYNGGLAWIENGQYRNQMYVDKVVSVMKTLESK